MITKEQIRVLCKKGQRSITTYAVLDYDFKSAFLGCTLPAKTIVEITVCCVGPVYIIDATLNRKLVDVGMNPKYLTLLNPPITPERRSMKATHAFAVVVMFGLLMYLGASWIWAH